MLDQLAPTDRRVFSLRLFFSLPFRRIIEQGFSLDFLIARCVNFFSRFFSQLGISLIFLRRIRRLYRPPVETFMRVRLRDIFFLVYPFEVPLISSFSLTRRYSRRLLSAGPVPIIHLLQNLS